jgi:hypothetical protein
MTELPHDLAPTPLPARPVIDLPFRRLVALLTLGASLALLALSLAAAPQALARAHSSGCRPSSATHGGRHQGRCATAPRRSKSHAPRHHTKRKHAGHSGAKPTSVKRARAKVRLRASATLAPQALSSPVPANCADGSAPLRIEAEVFECEDGSEPRCEAGSTMTLSSDGSTLLCSATLPTAPGSAEGECEAASPTACDPESGGPACPDAGARGAGTSTPACEPAAEPGCEAPSGPAHAASEPPLVCDVPGEEAAEAAIARQPGA